MDFNGQVKWRKSMIYMIDSRASNGCKVGPRGGQETRETANEKIYLLHGGPCPNSHLTKKRYYS